MTSIEFLLRELYNNDIPYYFSEVIQEAKEMHKQEIIDAWEMGRFNIDDVGLGQEYYQETFKKD
jgi:hypothetical protein